MESLNYPSLSASSYFRIIRAIGKRTFISLSILFYFGFIQSSIVAAQDQKPNIIFILGDDIGYKSIKCNGGNLYSTPYLDTLAQLGMRFTQCHASPLCSPSRFSLLTGKYNFRNYKQALIQRQEALFYSFKRAIKIIFIQENSKIVWKIRMI